MDNTRNWQGWAALVLAGLALFVALSGHLNFSFSLSDGGNVVAFPQASQLDTVPAAPAPPRAGSVAPDQLQALQDQLDALRAQANAGGQAIAPPVAPAVPQAPSLNPRMPNVPNLQQEWQGGMTEHRFGPFGGGGFGGGPFSMLSRLLPLIGLGLLAWFFFFRRRRGSPPAGPAQSARRATTPLTGAPPPEGPTGAQP
jgi:hypothetical protein